MMYLSLSAFRFPFISYPPPAGLSNVALGSFPRVALESAPLKGHESIFNTFSKGPFRPLSQGEKASGHLKPESTTPTNFVPLSQGDEREARRGYVKNYER